MRGVHNRKKSLEYTLKYHERTTGTIPDDNGMCRAKLFRHKKTSRGKGKIFFAASTPRQNKNSQSVMVTKPNLTVSKNKVKRVEDKFDDVRFVFNRKCVYHHSPNTFKQILEQEDEEESIIMDAVCLDLYVVFEREAREFQSFSHFHVSITSSQEYHSHRPLIPQRNHSKINAMMSKTKLALRARTQVQRVW